MKNYQHLFFDLDHTLWDFESNSTETLQELFSHYNLGAKLQITDADFIKTYQHINDGLWALYRQNKIEKSTLRLKRFSSTFATFGWHDEALSRSFDKDYLVRSPYKKNLLAGCLDMLTLLKEHFQLHIITNGFKETQIIKIRESGLQPFFETVLSSDEVQVLKPQAKIFIEAMQRSKANRKDSLMIGDSLIADVLGAKNVGMHQVYYNPLQKPHQEEITYEITHLAELPPILLNQPPHTQKR
jgi:putative hydrolase of the HAD superfamily